MTGYGKGSTSPRRAHNNTVNNNINGGDSIADPVQAKASLISINDHSIYNKSSSVPPGSVFNNGGVNNLKNQNKLKVPKLMMPLNTAS